MRALCESTQAEIVVSPWDASAIGALCQQIVPTVVFACLGTTRAKMREAKRQGHEAASAGYEAIDYGLTVMALDAVRDQTPPPRFVYLSAMGVKASSRNAYMAIRWRAEEAVRTSGVPYTIARPGFITGSDREESRPLERVAAVTSDGLLSVLGAFGARRLRRRYTSLDATSLAEGLLHWALAEEGLDRVVENEELRR